MGRCGNNVIKIEEILNQVLSSKSVAIIWSRSKRENAAARIVSQKPFFLKLLFRLRALEILDVVSERKVSLGAHMRYVFTVCGDLLDFIHKSKCQNNKN